MTIIEIGKYGIKGVMLDGYMPDFSELKKFDWDYAAENVLSKSPWRQKRFEKIRRHLEPGARKQSSFINSAIYAGLRESIINRYCPYKDRSELPCHQRFHPSKGADSMKHIFSIDLRMSPEETFRIFNADAEADINKSKGEYACVPIIVDLRPDTGCQYFKECNLNWIDFLNFKPKIAEEYSDFETYKKYAEKVLIINMISYESKYFNDRRLRRFFDPEFFK